MSRICISLILLCLMPSQSSAARVRSSASRRNYTIASGTVGKREIIILSAVGAAIGSYFNAFAAAHPVITGVGTFALFIEAMAAEIRLERAIEYRCRLAALQGINEGARRDAHAARGSGRGAGRPRATQGGRPGSSHLQVGEMIDVASDKPTSKESDPQRLLSGQGTTVEAPASRLEMHAMGFAVKPGDQEQVFDLAHVFQNGDGTNRSDMLMAPENLGPLTSTVASQEAGLNISSDHFVMFERVEVTFLGNDTHLKELVRSDVLSESIASIAKYAFQMLRNSNIESKSRAEVDERNGDFRVALAASVF